MWVKFGGMALAAALLATAAPSAATQGGAPILNSGDSNPTPNTGNLPASPRRAPDHYESCALEAQWAASAAARDAARWAWWQMILTAFGFGALIYNLFLTRRATGAAIAATSSAEEALRIAERNAQAASDQVRISEAAAKAYVDIEKVNFVRYETNDTEETVGIAIATTMRNVGTTPAHDAALSLAINHHSKSGVRCVGGGEKKRPVGAISPLHEGRVIEFVFPIPRPDWLRIVSDDNWISVVATVQYADIFRGRHEVISSFRSMKGGEEFNLGNSQHLSR